MCGHAYRFVISGWLLGARLVYGSSCLMSDTNTNTRPIDAGSRPNPPSRLCRSGLGAIAAAYSARRISRQRASAARTGPGPCLKVRSIPIPRISSPACQGSARRRRDRPLRGGHRAWRRRPAVAGSISAVRWPSTSAARPPPHSRRLRRVSAPPAGAGAMSNRSPHTRPPRRCMHERASGGPIGQQVVPGGWCAVAPPDAGGERCLLRPGRRRAGNIHDHRRERVGQDDPVAHDPGAGAAKFRRNCLHGPVGGPFRSGGAVVLHGKGATSISEPVRGVQSAQAG